MKNGWCTYILHLLTRCNCKRKTPKYPTTQEDKDVKNIQTFGII